MKLLRRLKNLWELSRFEITEFDNKLVISEKDGQLIVEKPSAPRMAQIIRRKSPVDNFLNENTNA